MPRINGDAKSVELRASELAMMLDGIDLRSVTPKMLGPLIRGVDGVDGGDGV